MLAVSEKAVEKKKNLASAAPTRLLVVDDHPAVRIGLRSLLEDQPDFVIVDAVGTAEAALSVAEREAIDVAVVDYQLAGRSGMWVSRKLKRLAPAPKVLIYSAYSDGVLAAACVVAEADGLVSKGGVGSALCDAIRSVASGRLLLPMVPSPVAAMIREWLDEQDRAILLLLLAGLGPAMVAQTLGVSSERVDSSMWKVLGRLESLQVDPSIPRGARASVRGRRLMRPRALPERFG
jgi:DNA-binding NarL/FixJ family response regulator